MEKISKKSSTKLSKTFLIIGIIIFIIGVVLIVMGILHVKKLQQDYDDWHQRWWHDKTADLNDQPSTVSALLIIGIFVSAISLIPVFIGLSPYITKATFKLKKETLDYAGQDISEVGMKGINLVKPVVKKGVDEIITPNVGSIVNSVKNPNHTAKTCPYCGDVVDADEVFCSNCGKQLKIKCPECEYLNSSANKFCKKCGKELNKENIKK